MKLPKLPLHVTRAQLATAGAIVVAVLALLGVIRIDGGTTPTPAPQAPSTAGTTAQLVHQAAASVPDLHMRDETPPGLSHATEVARQNGLEALAHHDQLPLVSPDAAPQIKGCTSNFVQDYSSRGGVKPRELVAHYTVSHNVPGLADVNAIHNLFDTWAYQASANFTIDAEGNCLYLVRDTDKAWAQAAANPFSVSIEFVAYGDEGKLSAAALRKGGQVFAIEAKKWGIPIRLGGVSNCLPTRPGIVDHAMLGVCGGGHHDLRPMYGSSAVRNPADDAKVLAPLIAATKKAAGGASAAMSTSELKARLRNAGYEKVSSDKTYGPTARAAVRAFKCEQALPCSTKRGPALTSALEHPNETVKPGTHGARVRAAKWELRRHGWHHVTLDRTYGPSAQHAVKVFKRHHRLPHDKVVGTATWRALR